MVKTFSRRSFVKTAVGVGALAAMPTGFCLSGCSNEGELAPEQGGEGETSTGLPFDADKVCYTKCGHGDVCGAYHMANAYVKDGVIVGYEGCPEGHNKGALCTRGISGMQVFYSPHRLKYPMKTAVRGSGEWERISWDEAYATIADKIATAIKDHGAHTVSVSDAHIPTQVAAKAFNRFRTLFGFVNGKGPEHCWSNLMVGAWPALGDYAHMKESQIAQSKLIVCWGHNPALGMPTEWRDGFMKAKLENGAKIVVVDPYFTATAEKADMFLQLRPGTDAALALGVANVMITEDLVNHDFIENYTVGYEDYKELALQYPPETVEEITWVPADTIREFARLYASVSPALIEMGRGGNYVSGDAGWLCSRGTTCLCGLKGDLGMAGGGFSVENSTFSPGFTSFVADWPWNSYTKVDRITEPVLGENGKEIATGGSFNGTKILYEGDPIRYQVYFTHTDIASKWADQNKLEEGLREIPFIVIQNQFINYTAQNFADIVLPCTSWVEDTMLYDEYSHMLCSAPVIDPMYEAKPSFLMLAELTDYICDALGVEQPEEKFFPDRTPEDIVNALLTSEELPEGGYPNITYEQLTTMPAGIRGARDYNKEEYVLYRVDGDPNKDYEFLTPSGKFEFKSDWFAEQYGLPALPVHSEPVDSPVALAELGEEYPLVGNARVHRSYGFLQFGIIADGGHASPVIREIFSSARESTVELNPTTAAELGLAEGDSAIVESQNGKIECKVHLTERCHPKLVVTPYYWGKVQNRLSPHTPSLFPGINVPGVGKYGEGKTKNNRGGQGVYAGYGVKVYKA